MPGLFPDTATVWRRSGGRRRRMVRPIAAGLTVLVHLLLPGVAGAQSSERLDAVRKAADAGELEAARAALRAWFAESPREDRAELARARFLRARLARDLDSAQVDYLWVAVQGDEPYAPLARLRLAQLRLARGLPERALEDLERLRADYPDTPLGAASWLWTGNALAEIGAGARACSAWQRAASLLPETHEEGRLARQALARCSPEGELYGAGGGGYSVQLGAFGSREAALELRDRVAKEGVSVRVIEPSSGDVLYRVRSGRFDTREDAARRAAALADAGFEAIVVREER